MKRHRIAVVLTTMGLLAPAFLAGRGLTALELPWREAGLTQRQAAAHLLDRLAYGARPGEIDSVVETGLEEWVEEQLRADLPDPDVERRLRPLDTLDMPAGEIARTFPNPGMVRRMAVAAGAVDDPRRSPRTEGEDPAQRARRDGMRAVMEWAEKQGYRPQRELMAQLFAQKLLRAVYSENQLQEVLTDFWFNHFNVSLTDNQARGFLLSYERDAIRPHVLGDFDAMLEATARHPAMLFYLDNAQSGANEGQRTTVETRMGPRGPRGMRGSRGRGGAPSRPRPRRGPEGLNENYARELLELHTLGVDGGYTQDDVVEVARAFTGWTARPPAGLMRERDRRRLAMVQRRGGDLGFVVEEQFLFRADLHDAQPKTVLGVDLPGGRGIEDGLQVLHIVGRHPSTAHHLSRKLATRFVSDEPPESLVERLAGTYLRSGGNLQRMMETLVESPEFWSPEARRQKIKSPFELAVSALRALDADVVNPRGVVEWTRRMGQPLYAYQAPTGFPDRAEAWVNTGSLLNRMNFGLQLASGRVAGVEMDLAALDEGREPESAEDGLETYAALLLPERELEGTLERLRPMLRDPELLEKVEARAPAAPPAGADLEEPEPPSRAAPGMEPGRRTGMDSGRADRFHRRSGGRDRSRSHDEPGTLAQVVGLILGSPEFQRR